MIVQTNNSNSSKQSLTIEIEPGDEVIIRVKEQPNTINIRTPLAPSFVNPVQPPVSTTTSDFLVRPLTRYEETEDGGGLYGRGNGQRKTR